MVNVYALDFNKEYSNPQVSCFKAYQGFKFMGGHCKLVSENDEIYDENKENLAIGGIGFVKNRLKYLKINIPEILDYPTELYGYLGRNVWTSTIDDVAKHPEKGFFIKPKHNNKFFTGKIIRNMSDLASCGIQGANYEVWCSELIKPVVEYRCFVRYGKILDIRHYRGDFRIRPDYSLIEKSIKEYLTSPKAYGIDFCVNNEGKTLLVEVNDGYSLGDYGIDFLQYAKMLYTRWAEIVDCEDYFNF